MPLRAIPLRVKTRWIPNDVVPGYFDRRRHVMSGVLQSHEMKQAGEQSVSAKGFGRLLHMIAQRRGAGIVSQLCTGNTARQIRPARKDQRTTRVGRPDRARRCRPCGWLVDVENQSGSLFEVC